MLLWHFYSAAVHNTDRATMLLEQLDDPVVVGQWAMLVAAFSGYHWPGNVRELRNVCQQIAGSSAEAEKFSVPEHVLEMLQGALGRKLNASRAYRPASGLSDTEVRDALSNSDWEMSRAARVLKVSRPALYKRVQMIPDIRVAGDVPVAEVEASYRECEGRLALAADSLRVSRTGLGRRWRAMELEARDF
jgi:transcriptional regulator with AAA-type ATPase domain